MLRFWSLVFPHYQLPITNYQPTRQYKYSREHDIKVFCYLCIEFLLGRQLENIGTLDGANVGIRQEVGAENFFLFGMNAEEVSALKARGYNPRDYYNSNAQLKEIIDQIASGYFIFGTSRLVRADCGLFT
jgi:glucan phosphorylase